MESCGGRSKQNKCRNSKVAGRRCIVRVRVAGVSTGKGWWRVACLEFQGGGRREKGETFAELNKEEEMRTCWSLFELDGQRI